MFGKEFKFSKLGKNIVFRCLLAKNADHSAEYICVTDKVNRHLSKKMKKSLGKRNLNL